jgi:hypothetical protein
MKNLKNAGGKRRSASTLKMEAIYFFETSGFPEIHDVTTQYIQ